MHKHTRTGTSCYKFRKNTTARFNYRYENLLLQPQKVNFTHISLVSVRVPTRNNSTYNPFSPIGNQRSFDREIVCLEYARCGLNIASWKIVAQRVAYQLSFCLVL